MDNGQNQLEKENARLKDENEKLQKMINNLKKEIVNYKEGIKELQGNFRISIEKALSDKRLLEMAINGDIPKIEELQKLGVIGDFLKPKENIIQINAENNEINVNQHYIKM